MLRRHGLFVSLALASCLLPGCMGFHIKNGIPYFSKNDQWEPPEEEDKVEVRRRTDGVCGNRQLEDERDPLKGSVDVERSARYRTKSGLQVRSEAQLSKSLNDPKTEAAWQCLSQNSIVSVHDTCGSGFRTSSRS